MTHVPDSKRLVILQVLAFSVPVLLYLTTLTFGFVDFDDRDLILNKAPFLTDFTNIPRAFLTDAFLDKASAFYRPLQTVSYMVDIRLAGKISVAVLHGTNVVLLGLISWAIFRLLAALSVAPSLAATAAALYGVHPLFLSTVAWIPARGDLLLALFSLVSFLLLISWLDKGTFARLFLHWGAFTLALFSKETAVVLPVLYGAYTWLVAGERRLDKRYILPLCGYLVSGVIWYALRSHAILTIPSANALIGAEAVAANLRIIPESFASLLLPVAIAPIPAFSAAKTGIGIALIAATAFLLVRTRENRAINLFCCAWYLLLIAPSLLFKHHLIDYLSHRFFLPCIGILIFATVNMPRRWLQQATAMRGIALVLLALLGAATFTAAAAYRDPRAFYNAAVTLNPKSALAYNNRGLVSVQGKDLLRAMADFTSAIQIYPEYEEAFSNRGVAKLRAGDPHGAIADLTTAITINSSFALPYYHRGRAYYDLQDYRRAAADFSACVSLTSEYAEAYLYLGQALSQLGDFPAAIGSFGKAIAAHPGQYQAYLYRAIAREYIRDYRGVSEDCDMVLALHPGESTALRLKGAAVRALQGNKQGI
jgi:tetratricopeptide (TPR) repeat protein